MDFAYYYYYFIYHSRTNEFRDAMPMLIHFYVSALFLLLQRRMQIEAAKNFNVVSRYCEAQKIELKKEKKKQSEDKHTYGERKASKMRICFD